MTNLAFHHFGLAVRQPDEAIKFLEALGYSLGKPIYDAHQNVHLMMGTHASQPAVEIIYPGTDKGPIDRLVQRHTSGIIYHLCYVTGNLSATLAQFEAAGLKALCISPPKPALLFNGRKVSFYNVTGMGLIELLE